MTSPTSATCELPTSLHQEGSQFRDTRVSGGVLVQGNVVGLTINATALAQVDYAGHYAHGSLHPVKTFVERPELRDQIRKILARDGSETQEKHQSNVMAVWGLGGMGKTQLVLDYLQRHRADYKATLWIEAGQKSTIERDFVNIYRLLFETPLSAGGDRQDRFTEAVLRVKSWFSQKNERWLFVFDGADSVDVPDDREYVDLPYFMPESSTIDIIITSRSNTVQEFATLGGVDVGEMDRDQAVELFYKASLTAPSLEIGKVVRRIVDELGCLALAVSLAGTYVRETPRLRSDISQYLVEFRERRKELLQRKPTRLIHQYSESVLTTWETSFQAVQEQYPAAANLLTMLAFLSYDDIYLDLFGLDDASIHKKYDDDHIGRHVASWQTRLFPKEQINLYMIEECFRMLERYALVQWQGDQESYGMHRLVHAWGCDRLSTAEQEIFAVGSVELISDAISRCGATPRDKLRLAPHIMASFGVVSSVGLKRTYREDTLRQVQVMGVFLNGMGRWSDVSTIEMFIFSKCIGSLGEEHPSTISAMNNLANTLGEQGQLDEAAKMKKEVLEKRKRILGEEHPSTISAMNNLANTLGEQGQLDEAAKMLQEVLEKMRHILGEEHPSTISAMNNLASTIGDQGQLDEAAKMKKEVLEKRKRILGEEHPDTISAMNNLANTLRDQGQLDEAAKMLQEVLEKRKRILGEEHPSTISAMNNLASTLRDQGQLDEAAKMIQEVLEKRKRILGEEHPDTISAMNNLASTLRDQGQLDEAAKMLQEVLEKTRRILGEEHPDTISAMNNLASTLGEQGQLDEAAKMLQEVLEKIRRILGEEHPSTISVMNNLASTLRDQGQLDEAAKMLQEVLEKGKRILGEEHPDTTSAMNNLANTLGDQGQLDDAIALLEVAVQRMKRIHGNEHPHTRIASSNLARLRACPTSVQKPEARSSSKKSSSLSTRIKGMFRKRGDVE